MYCTKCGFELRDSDSFCSQCGIRTATREQQEKPQILMLDKRNKKIAGVCAGFARYFGMDLVLMRVLWLGIALCTGVGFHSLSGGLDCDSARLRLRNARCPAGPGTRSANDLSGGVQPKMQS